MHSLLLIFLLGSSPAFADAGSNPIPRSWTDFLRSSADEEVVVSILEMNPWEVCRAWGVEQRERTAARKTAAMREFLLHRGLITRRDISMVPERQFGIGMSQCGLFASLGYPKRANRTTTAEGTTSQLVYRDGRLVFYTDEKSIVTAIQQH